MRKPIFDEDGWFIMPEHGEILDDKAYYENHRTRASLNLVKDLVNSINDCSSILDVGCGSVGFLALVDKKYTKKSAIDIYKPAFFGFDVNDVVFTHGDFLTEPLDCFDIVVCLECLEHIKPIQRQDFAKKLLEKTKKHLIISIPYMWKNSNEPIPHNNLNETDVLQWFYPTEPIKSWKSSGHYIALFNK